jgi:superfamily I DNA/RNA helicase
MGLDLEKQAKGSGSGIQGGADAGHVRPGHHLSQVPGFRVGLVCTWSTRLPNMMAMTTRNEGAKAAEAQARRWLYTAVTRASERVTITTPNRSR